ncbi:MAG: YiiX/YebB-like N1pC/P60 family cysteine hydrolase [Mycoplasmatales bacterium]
MSFFKKVLFVILLLLSIVSQVNFTSVNAETIDQKKTVEISGEEKEVSTWNPQNGSKYEKGDLVEKNGEVKIVIQNFIANGDDNWWNADSLFTYFTSLENASPRIFTEQNLKDAYIEYKKMSSEEAAREVLATNKEIEQMLMADEENPSPLENLEQVKNDAYGSIIAELSGQKEKVTKAIVDKIAAEKGLSQDEAFMELNPRMAEISKGNFDYNENTGEMTTYLEKDDMFGAQTKGAFEQLGRGDILNNFSNGSLGVRWGHAAIITQKSNTVSGTYTTEAVGPGKGVQKLSYSNWHYNNNDKMAYSYLTKFRFGSNYYSGATNASADLASAQVGKKYTFPGISLGDPSSFYCSELVYYAYYANRYTGVDLGSYGNNKRGSNAILYPYELYMDNDIMPFFKQNF